MSLSPTISALAGHAQRTYEMRQGVLAAAAFPEVDVAPARQLRHFGPAVIRVRPNPTPRPREPILSGANLLHGVAALLLGGAAVIASILLIDFGVAKYQADEIRERWAADREIGRHGAFQPTK